MSCFFFFLNTPLSLSAAHEAKPVITDCLIAISLVYWLLCKAFSAPDLATAAQCPGSCGNLSAGVGLFALAEGFVKPQKGWASWHFLHFKTSQNPAVPEKTGGICMYLPGICPESGSQNISNLF